MSAGDQTVPVSAWLRLWRRCRSVLWTAVFLITVGLAIIVGMGRALSPYAGKLRPWLEMQLSAELGVPVSISELSADWQGLNPVLHLRELALGESDSEGLSFECARLRIHMLNWLLPRRDDWNLELSGVVLSVQRDVQGRWGIRGLGEGDGDALDYRVLMQLGDVTIRDSQLLLVGEVAQRQLAVDQVTLRQQSDGLRLSGDLSLENAEPLQLRMSLQENPAEPDVKVYFEAQNQPLLAWLSLFDAQWAERERAELPRGVVDMVVWLDWNEPGHGALSGKFLWRDESGATAAAGAADNAAGVPPKHADGPLSASVWVDWQPERWSLRVADLRQDVAAVPSSGLAATPGWFSVAQGDALEVYGAELDLSLIPQLAAWWPAAPQFMRQPGWQGRLEHLEVALDAQGQWRQMAARFDGLSWPASGQQPGGSGVAGELTLADGVGKFTAHRGELLAPAVFSVPLPVNRLALDFELHRQTDDWQLHVPQLHWDSGAFELAANARYRTDSEQKSRDWLELSAAITGLEVDEALHFLPSGVIGRRTGQWLQRSLKSGRIDSIRAVLQGHLADWPFEHGEGTFLASAQLVENELAFSPEWPPVKDLNGVLTFTPKQMRIDQASAQFAGAPIQTLQANIADMNAAVLELAVNSASDANRHLQMLGRLPLRAGAWVEDTDLSLQGPTRIAADLQVDFRDGRSDTRIDGETFFDKVNANYNQRIQLDALNGSFRFDNNGLQPASLAVMWREQPGQLSFGAEPFSVSLSGRFDSAAVLAVAGIEEYWQAYLTGRSLWHWQLVPGSDASYVQVASDLIGTAVTLPDPLAKLAPVPRALSAVIPFNARAPVQVRYGGALDAVVMLDEQSAVDSVDLRLSGGDRGASGEAHVPRAVPAPPGAARIAGYGGVADAMGWVDVIESLATHSTVAERSRLEWRGDSRYQRLQLMGRYFSDARLSFERMGEHWSVGLDGAEISGHVRLPAGVSASDTIVAEFDRLHLPAPPPTTISQALTDPMAMPALHLFAKDLQWEDWPVGQVQVQAFPVENGLRFETINARNPQFTLTGQGEWLHDEQEIQSRLDLRVDAEHLGTLLESLGYGAVVDGGQTVIDLHGWWMGGPSDFALQRLHGTLDVNVVQGRFLEAGAGAGRMLGLMSVQALPRRIMLDFRDVFETGLNFDRLHGNFLLADGFAATDGLEIEATAAKIVVSGRTDLVNREYDQTVSIRPGVGSTLPVIGAIAGGPVGATAGLALQGLLQKPLGGLTKVTYRVTGPWADPVVSDVDEESPAPAAEHQRDESAAEAHQAE